MLAYNGPFNSRRQTEHLNFHFIFIYITNFPQQHFAYHKFLFVTLYAALAEFVELFVIFLF